MKKILHIGLDVGSTTVKIVALDDEKNIVFSNYTRHFSDTKKTLFDILNKLLKDYPEYNFTLALTGSGSIDISKYLSW